MTKKLSMRLTCLSIMLLLLVFSPPAGAGQYPPRPSCDSLCFRQYMDCMWYGYAPPDVCDSQYMECMARCPPEE